MHEWQSLSHVRWDCKYHVVIVPKYRQRRLYGQVGQIIRDLCRQKGVELFEGHLMPDQVHMCRSVPPKFSIAFVIGFLKGKSAVRIHRNVLEKPRVTGLHFWSRGYCVSTVGLDEQTIRTYIREQEKVEKQQLDLEPHEKPDMPIPLIPEGVERFTQGGGLEKIQVGVAVEFFAVLIRGADKGRLLDETADNEAAVQKFLRCPGTVTEKRQTAAYNKQK